MGELLTPRLRLRQWEERDRGPMAAINADPEVRRFLNREITATTIAAFHDTAVAHWAAHGVGLYAAELLDGPDAGLCLGFVGIAYPAFLPAIAHRPELGWRLGRAAWGKGLATEAATAVLEDARERLGLTPLIAIIHPDNVRSRRVATKLGMSVETQIYNPLLDLDVDIWSG